MNVPSRMIERVKHGVATRLRAVASILDGRRYVSPELHQLNVRTMNAYIGRTERYIVALERWAVTAALVHGVPAEGVLEDMRRRHGRFDTQGLLKAGAWPEVAEPPPYRTGEA